MLKNLAYLFGIVLLVIGVLGFVPSIAPAGTLFGIFNVNSVFNIFYIISGLLALVAGCNCVSKFTPRLYFQIFGVIFAVLTVLSYFYGTLPVLGILANNRADTVLELIIAVIYLYLGFVHKE